MLEGKIKDGRTQIYDTMYITAGGVWRAVCAIGINERSTAELNCAMSPGETPRTKRIRNGDQTYEPEKGRKNVSQRGTLETEEQKEEISHRY